MVVQAGLRTRLVMTVVAFANPLSKLSPQLAFVLAELKSIFNHLFICNKFKLFVNILVILKIVKEVIKDAITCLLSPRGVRFSGSDLSDSGLLDGLLNYFLVEDVALGTDDEVELSNVRHYYAKLFIEGCYVGVRYFVNNDNNNNDDDDDDDDDG